jgi:hypothetical protein
MQNTLFPKFVLYRLRLLLELGARRQTLPAYLGSTVRGIFAASFRHVVCVTRAPVCDGCLLLHRCPYPYIPVIFQAEVGIVRDDVQAITLADVQHPGDSEVQQVTLELLTPLRVKKYGDYQASGERLEFVTLIDLLLGRLEALSLFHCGDAWAPNTALREAARSVQVVAKHLTLQRLERYSNRHHQKLPLHGVIGTLSFAGNLAPFLPLLRLGTYLHIGAGTAFGLGHYRLSTIR